MSLSILPCCVTNVEIYISMNISISASGSSDRQSLTLNYTNSSNGLISIPNANYGGDPTGCTVCGYQGFNGDTIDNGFFAGGVEYNQLIIPLLGPECPEFAIPGSCAGCGLTFCDSGQTLRITSSDVPNDESDFQGQTCEYNYIDEDGNTQSGSANNSDYCTNVAGNICNSGNCSSDATLLVYHPSLENTTKHSLSLNFNSQTSRLPISISTTSGGYPISGGLYVNGSSIPAPLYVTYSSFNSLPSWVTSRSISGSVNIGVMYNTNQARNPQTGLCPSV
jgi:hypothetical protein